MPVLSLRRVFAPPLPGTYVPAGVPRVLSDFGSTGVTVGYSYWTACVRVLSPIYDCYIHVCVYVWIHDSLAESDSNKHVAACSC